MSQTSARASSRAPAVSFFFEGERPDVPVALVATAPEAGRAPRARFGAAEPFDFQPVRPLTRLSFIEPPRDIGQTPRRTAGRFRGRASRVTPHAPEPKAENPARERLIDAHPQGHGHTAVGETGDLL